MQPFDIYQAAHRWLNCDDARPWLIVEVRAQGVYGSFPISGQCYGGNCFEISSSHENFAATGLSKSCFIHDQYIVELRANQFLRRRGALTGSMLAEFRRFAGL